MVLAEDPYASDQATSDISCEYNDFEISCDDYVEIFKEIMTRRRATQCYAVLPKIFNNYYTFRKRGIHSTLGVFKPKNSKAHARLMSWDFNPKDLTANPLQRGGFDAEQVLSLGLPSQTRVLH